MSINLQAYQRVVQELSTAGAQLVAVSKTKPAEDIQALYEAGQLDFGENYVQELVDKHAALPKDIRWHAIGHLQTNKVKYIAPFVHLIHGVDSWKLLIEINKQATKCGRTIDCLLQVHIAQEETKFGMDETEITSALNQLHQLPAVRVRGLMGMASFTDDHHQVKAEFHKLNKLFQQYANHAAVAGLWNTLSMGMSSDYHIALSEGSTMVRIGSMLFGARG